MGSPAMDQGFLVVASPELADPNFHRAVVLMISHDRHGSFGLILNRPLKSMLADVLEPAEGDAPGMAANVPLLCGGPVSTDLVQFVSNAEQCGRIVVPGVAVGADLSELSCATAADLPLRAYAGYSGWGAGQLERETEEGSWIIAPAAARHVFEIHHDELWATVLRDLGGSYAWMALDGGQPGDN